MKTGKAKRRQRPSISDRIAEYVDSPRLRNRMLDGDWIVATVDGNFGAYTTQARIRSKGKACALRDWSCTCPSEYSPCKHVSALVETWRINAKSFDDLAPRWKTLSLKPKGSLIQLIREIGEVHPGALRFALGLSDRVEEVSEHAERDW